MAQEINRYDINTGVTYNGTALPNGGVLFSPGSQWGAPIAPSGNGPWTAISGTDLMYPGYLSPQALDAVGKSNEVIG